MSKQFISFLIVSLCAIPSTLLSAPLATTTTLTPPPTSVYIGTVITLTASVAAGGTPVSPGLITFNDGKAVLGSAQLLAAGNASIKLRLGLGAHSLTANFAGTNTYAKSSSSTQMVTVTPITGPAATTTTIDFSGANNDYTLTAVVNSLGMGALTGTVSFLDQTDGNPYGTLALTPSAAFLPQQTYETGFRPTWIAVGDFNRDGIPDLVTADAGDQTLDVLLGVGDGSFQLQETYEVGTQSVAVADFNSDGVLDLALANPNGGVAVMFGKHDGTFGAPYGYGVGGSQSITVGDFNGDGFPDLVVANNGRDTVAVMLNKGDGYFIHSPQTFATAGSPNSVAVGDFNGDGILDLAAVNGFMNGTTSCAVDVSCTSVSVLLGNGDGTFQAQTPYTVGNSPQSVAVGDFNGDGFLDLVVANANDDTVSLLFGKGDGTFRPQQTVPVGQAPSSVAVGDFNGDGIPDLAVSNYGMPLPVAGTVSVLLGNGNGTFQPEQIYGTGLGNQFVAIGDFNGDGLPDLAVANSFEDNTVGVFLNQPRGTATLANISIPGAKMQTVVASYSGDPDHAPSVSLPIGLTPTSIRMLTLSATSLAFGTEAGPASAPQVVTVTNTGTDEVDEISIAFGGFDPSKFSETTTCGVSLVKGASCTISVTFMPTSAASYSAVLYVHSDAPGAPQQILLTGTGLGVRSLTFNPTNLAFASAALGTTTPAQVVTVTNNGSTGVYNMSVILNGANTSVFGETTTCGTSLAPGASCTASVTFTPATNANYAATLVIHSDAPGAPENIPITGTSDPLSLTLNPTSVYIISDPQQNTPQNVTLTSNGPGTVGDISIALGTSGTNAYLFSETTTCGTTLAAGTSCTITVTFAGGFDENDNPIGGNGVIEVFSDAPGSPLMLPVSGSTNDCGYHGAPPCEPDVLRKL